MTRSLDAAGVSGRAIRIALMLADPLENVRSTAHSIPPSTGTYALGYPLQIARLQDLRHRCVRRFGAHRC